MKKGLRDFQPFQRGTQNVFLKVEIKTLHHTKLRSLYKSRYSACIKDNKTYSSLLFSLNSSNLLLKWLSRGRKVSHFHAKTEKLSGVGAASW